MTSATLSRPDAPVTGSRGSVETGDWLFDWAPEGPARRPDLRADLADVYLPGILVMLVLAIISVVLVTVPI